MNEYGCNVCNEEYSVDDEMKCPRVLTGCGHTICHGCASSIAKAGRPAIFCPFDRISTSIPGGNIQNLKKNFALLELLEKIFQGELSVDRRDQLQDRYSKERILNLKCDEDPNHVAVVYCTVCESNLCERCSESSHSTNVLSKHRRVPLTEKPPSLVNCKLHLSYVVEFVCKEASCDNESPLMCLMCRDYGRHKGHHHVLIEKEVDDLREKVRIHLGELTRQSEVVSSALSSLNSAIHELSPGRESGTLVDTRAEVRTHFRQLRTKLEEDEEAAIDKLESHARSKVEALQAHKDRLEAMSMKIGNTCIELQNALILEKNKILDSKEELLALAESSSAEPAKTPDASQLCTQIAFSISSDRRLHIGEFIDSRVVLLGIDGAGKTSIVRRLLKHTNCVAAPLPTIGFHVETVYYKNYKLGLWDVGGLPKLRSLWKYYYPDSQAIIYVIDGHAVERFPETMRELMKLLEDPLIATCAFIVAINRKDGSQMDGIVESLVAQLTAIRFPLQIHHCDASSGSGIDQILHNITLSISRLNGDCPV